jgi:SAM-dependent methyltransferase
MMKPLKYPLPPGRSIEQVWRHYEMESQIARRLLQADRAERQRIFETMYADLFAAVPDHPRLTQRDTPATTVTANSRKWRWFGAFLNERSVALEFAPGDCEFCAFVAPRVQRLYGVDISDQRNPERRWPDNFELILYDGYDLSQIASDSIDVAFSNQFIEHLHPDDAEAHLLLVKRILKPGGRYVIRTPHRLSGPWDVSRYFSDVAEGFHLKEWTYTDLHATLRRLGYSRVRALWGKRNVAVDVPMPLYRGFESVAERMSRRNARRMARWLAPMVFCVAVK